MSIDNKLPTQQQVSDALQASAAGLAILQDYVLNVDDLIVKAQNVLDTEHGLLTENKRLSDIIANGQIIPPMNEDAVNGIIPTTVAPASPKLSTYKPDIFYPSEKGSSQMIRVASHSHLERSLLSTTRMIDEISIHCSATRPNWADNGTRLAQIYQEIYGWHVIDNKWSDVGYHYLIARDGRIIICRPVSRAPAVIRHHNSGLLGICLIGGFGGASTDKFEEHFTQLQKETLLWLIGVIKDNKPAVTQVTGHNQYAAKACPSFTVPEFMLNL